MSIYYSFFYQTCQRIFVFYVKWRLRAWKIVTFFSSLKYEIFKDVLQIVPFFPY